jgi:hypothetical protein
MTLFKYEIKSHLISLAVFAVIFLLLIFVSEKSKEQNPYSEIKKLLAIAELNEGNELDEAVFTDGIRAYYNSSPEKADSILNEYNAYKNYLLTSRESKANTDVRTLSTEVALKLTGKALVFLFYFTVIALLLFYLSESFALLKFKLEMQKVNKINKDIYELIREHKEERRAIRSFPLKKMLMLIFAAFGKVAAYLILFSPVYLVGYVFKFNYENITFIAYVLLAVFTNGVLVTSTNKFYRLLESEKTKGYVETAKIKGVKAGFGKRDGVSLLRIFLPVKYFGEHILTPIYKTAHLQYLSEFKEIARFQITGMIIVELALNFQNGIFYELLQSLLRKEYGILFFSLLLVFIVVKLVDIVSDYFFIKENRKYEN